MKKLSPAAQAVMDAYWQAPLSNEASVAAALHAAADQVAPEPSAHLPEQDCRWYRLGVSAYRHNLRAIANELEGMSN